MALRFLALAKGYGARVLVGSLDAADALAALDHELLAIGAAPHACAHGAAPARSLRVFPGQVCRDRAARTARARGPDGPVVADVSSGRR